MLTLRNGEARELIGFSSIEQIEKGRAIILLLDNEDVLEGYIIDEIIKKSNELCLTNEQTGICIGIMATKIVGWCYC